METNPVVEARVAPVRAIARDVDPEPEHAFQVHFLARALFGLTRPVHGLGDDSLALLEAGALLHDIGFLTGARKHHKHSRDWILAHGLPGFDEEEVAVVACLARYHRKAHPHPKHAVYGDLSESRREEVRRLAGILRIADGLDRAHVAAARALRTEHEGAQLRVCVAQAWASDADVWGAMRKRFLFEEEFGVQVEVVPEPARRTLRKNVKSGR